MSAKISLYKFPTKNIHGKYPLKIRINNSGKVNYINLGFTISDKEWNVNTKMLRKTAREYHDIIEAYDEKVEELLDENSDLDKNKVIQFLNKNDTIKKYYEEFLVHKKEKFRASTVKTNTIVKNLVYEFINNKDITVFKIDRIWIEEFHTSLEEKRLSINTIHAYFFSFIGFLKWLNKYKKIYIEYKNVRHICVNPCKNPKFNSELDFYKEIIHNLDYFRQMRENTYKYFCQYMLSISLCGARISDLNLLRLSNFRTITRRKDVFIDEEECDCDTIIIKDVECRYKMLKSKEHMEIKFLLSPSAYKYLIYFMDKEFQIRYAKKFENCIIGKLAGIYSNNDFNDDETFNNLKLLYALESNENFKRTFKYNETEKLDGTGSLEDFDESEKTTFAKELFIEQLDKLGKDNSIDRFLTEQFGEGYLNLTEVEKMNYRNVKSRNFNRGIKRTCEKFGMNFYTAHTARHSYAQLCVMNNTDKFAMRDSLGHKSITTTELYVKSLAAEDLSEKIAPALENL